MAAAACRTRVFGTSNCRGNGPTTLSDPEESLVLPIGDVLDRLSRDPSWMSERSAEGGITTRPARSMLPTWLLADEARDELGVGVFVGRPGGLVRVRPLVAVESPRTCAAGADLPLLSPPSSGFPSLGVTCVP